MLCRVDVPCALGLAAITDGEVFLAMMRACGVAIPRATMNGSGVR